MHRMLQLPATCIIVNFSPGSKAFYVVKGNGGNHDSGEKLLTAKWAFGHDTASLVDSITK